MSRPLANALAVALFAALLSACAGGSPPADTAATSEPASTAAAGAKNPGVIADCQKPSEEPSEITIACGDGNFVVADITWDSWGQDEAGGSGTAEVNLCEPNCADGKVGNYISGVTVSDIGDCDGQSAYRKIEIDFQDEAPPGYDDPYKTDLPC